MAKKIEIVGAKPKKIEIVDQPKRRVEPSELAAAFGANLAGGHTAAGLDLIALAELGTQLLGRLRSSGGRPALTDATEICRVPLSAGDIKTLEEIVGQIEGSSGAKPSVGQLVSVIVRKHLEALKAQPDPARKGDAPKGEVEQPVAITILQQMLDEQLTPLREKVKRLESELHAGGGSSK